MTVESTNRGSDAASDTVSDEAIDNAVDDAVDVIVARGPAGAFAVAGIASAIVIVLYFAFYGLAYFPRGVIR